MLATPKLAIGTWVEFTTFREMSNFTVQYLHKVTGVVVQRWVLNGVGYYMVQYNGWRYPVPDKPLMIRALPNMPPLCI